MLDEPSSGLDPIVRRDILGAIIRTIADEGRTVLFSSHLLDEVERVARPRRDDRPRAGRLRRRIDDIKETHRRLTLRFDEPRPRPPRARRRARLARGRAASGRRSAAGTGSTTSETRRSGRRARSSTSGSPSLDEIFVARVGTTHLVAEGS